MQEEEEERRGEELTGDDGVPGLLAVGSPAGEGRRGRGGGDHRQWDGEGMGSEIWRGGRRVGLGKGRIYTAHVPKAKAAGVRERSSKCQTEGAVVIACFV